MKAGPRGSMSKGVEYELQRYDRGPNCAHGWYLNRRCQEWQVALAIRAWGGANDGPGRDDPEPEVSAGREMRMYGNLLHAIIQPIRYVARRNFSNEINRSPAAEPTLRETPHGCYGRRTQPPVRIACTAERADRPGSARSRLP